MSGSEDEREDFGAAEESSLLHGELLLYPKEKKKVHLWLKANVSLS